MIYYWVPNINHSVTVPELTSLRHWLPVPGDFLVGALEKIGKHFEKIGNSLRKGDGE